MPSKGTLVPLPACPGRQRPQEERCRSERDGRERILSSQQIARHGTSPDRRLRLSPAELRPPPAAGPGSDGCGSAGRRERRRPG
jgi:hypothetical protein